MPKASHLVFLLSLAAGCSSLGPPSPVPAAPQAPALRDGEPVAAEIGPGESHRYRLALPADRWASIELAQREVDLDLRILDAAGREVDAATTPGNWSEEVVDLVTSSAVPHTIEITPVTGTAHRGTYRLRLTESRPAHQDDPARLAARRELRALARDLDDLEPAAAEERVRRLLAVPGALGAEEEAHLHQLRGDVLFRTRRCEEAAASYRAGLARLADPAAGARAALLHRGIAKAAASCRDFDAAREHHHRAVAIARDSGDLAVLGTVLNNEALFLFDQGEGEAAVSAYREAVEAKRAADDRLGEQRLRLNLSGMLVALGRLEEALAESERSERLAIDGAIDDFDNRIGRLRNLAQLYSTGGQIEESLRALEEALAQALAAGDGWWELRLLLHLGATLNQVGDHRRARLALDRVVALAAAAEDDVHLASGRAYLGWAKLGEGEAAAAADLLTDALATPIQRADLRISLLHVLATAEIELGEHDAAHEHLAAAAEEARIGGLRLQAADIHRTLGSLQLARRELDEASVELARAAELADELADPLRQAAVASLLARLAAERGDPMASLEQARRAIRLREEVRSGLADPSLRASFLSRWRGDFDLAIEMLMRLAEAAPEADHARLAFELSEAAHARTLTELLAEARIDVRRGISRELLAAEQAAERRLSGVQTGLTKARAQSVGFARVAELEAAWRRAQDERLAVEVEIRRRHPLYAEIRYPRPPSVEEVRGWLPERTAVLEYALGERSSVLFVLTRDRFASLTLPPAGQISERVVAVREGLVGSVLGRNKLAASLADLTQLLIVPAAELLTEVDRLLVVPDRDLFYLPFEALGDPADRPSVPGGLLRRWTVTYLPSTAVLAHFAADESPLWEREVLLLADPPAIGKVAADLRGVLPDLLPQGGLAPLPGARREAERIAALFQQRAKLYLGEEARESLLKARERAPTARRLHIASHGRISETDPAASFVLLAAGEEEDGLLQMHEVFNLDLASELVVLSGCETALGPRVEGEGLLGLARGFLYAGARELVVSLWPVSDMATEDLMVDFYERIRDGLPTAEALRRAKLAALDAGAPAAAWAPFVIFAPPSSSRR